MGALETPRRFPIQSGLLPAGLLIGFGNPNQNARASFLSPQPLFLKNAWGRTVCQRVEVLAGFVEETPAAVRTVGQREAAFVLYYFLKGQDLIPDNIPEIGLLDDALLVETAFYRNLHELRSHWAAQGRPWPEKS